MVSVQRGNNSLALRRASTLGLALLLILALSVPGSIIASPHAEALGPCTVTNLNPHQAPDGSTTGFAFTVEDDNDSIAWIQVTSPSSNLVITSGSSDWLPNVVVAPDHAYFYGDPIGPGNPIQVSVSADVSSFPADNWTVEASTDSGGSGAFTCGGDTSVSVIDTTPPNITTITADASTTSAVIHWTTDKQTTGTVDYGKTASYGLQKSDSILGTSHSVTLTGLSPSTVYHYQITAVDQSSNSTASNDATFLTTEPSSGSGSGGGGGVPVTNPADKTPPTIKLTSQLPKILTTAPTVFGEASDNSKVARVEYSTDGGHNWLTVDTASGLGTMHVTFSFTPLNLDDNTYLFEARATDGGGNTATTKAVRVVIDRFAPFTGGSVISLGPQVLVPDSHGIIEALPNVNLTIHTSSTGGANGVAIDAMSVGMNGASLSTNFALQQAPDSGLWSGTMSFSEPGTYRLIARARDGAGNKTERIIGTIHVTQTGTVLSSNGPVKNALVTAYYRDPDTASWIVWDGQPYGQSNPQSTGIRGSFQMFLPTGTYYLHASANGYQDANTTSFTLGDPTPLTAVLHLDQTPSIGPVHIPWFSFSVTPLTRARTSIVGQRSKDVSLVGSAIPSLTLPDIAGANHSSINWLGKPTVITLLSTWAPSASEQVGFLSQLSANRDINSEVIGLQESAPRLRAYNAIAGISLPWLADPNSQTVQPLRAGSLPTHYFIDRKGIVREVVYGVLTYDEMVNHLTSLE